jgi:hypothetical protein
MELSTNRALGCVKLFSLTGSTFMITIIIITRGEWVVGTRTTLGTKCTRDKIYLGQTILELALQGCPGFVCLRATHPSLFPAHPRPQRI